MQLTREIKTPEFTLGRFSIDDQMFYWTVERPWKDNTPKISCIPEGKYQIKLQPSPHFGRDMPTLQDVPGRSHILIHPANLASELEGCIAIGLARTKNGVGASQVAFSDFMKRLETLLLKGDVWLEVS